MKHSKVLFSTLVFLPLFLCGNVVSLGLEDLGEMPPREKFLDPGCSLMGDVLLKNGGSSGVAAILKVVGSFCDMENKEKAFLDEGDRRLSTISDLLRTASYLSLCRSSKASGVEVFSKRFLEVAALRALATFSSWYARKMPSKEHWGVAKVIGSVSRAAADCMTGNKLVSLASLLSAGVDTYAMAKMVYPEWWKKLREEWNNVFNGGSPKVDDEPSRVVEAVATPVVTEKATVSDDKEDESEQEECWLCRHTKAKEEIIACEYCEKKVCKECIEKWVNTTDYDLYQHSNETNGEDMQYKVYEEDKTAYKGCPFCRADSEAFKVYRK